MIQLWRVREIATVAKAAGSLDVLGRQKRLCRRDLWLVRFLLDHGGALAAVTHSAAPIFCVVRDQRIGTGRLRDR